MPDRLVRWPARLATALLVTLLAGCATLPPLEGRATSTAATDTAATRLGRAIAPEAARHRGQSGVLAFTAPLDAFAARVFLARAAEATLDVQYYQWNDDETGALMLEALWRAAERGVRVRLLLDDINTGIDGTLAEMDAHPGIEVRLYNPFVHRRSRMLDFVADFGRVNRRMHNKSFTADNQAAIVGGRNVGNEYYGAGTGVEFTDLDVLAVGPIVRDVSAAFDLYWNSASAYPAGALLPPAPSDARARREEAFAATHRDADAAAYLEALRDSPAVRSLLLSRLPLEWTGARLVRDDPAKTLDGTADGQLLLLATLLPLVGPPAVSFDLVSPYFVPGDGGTAALESMARRGVRVRVLTNSLSATDVGPVHAGYAKRREALLRAGVRLYEFKPAGGPPAGSSSAGDTKLGLSGSRAAALHAKTFAIDARRIFVGSFNFDQRSAHLNTEMGLVVESAALAGRLVEAFDARIPTLAYEVRLRQDDGGLEWVERTPGGIVIHTVEPGTSAMRRTWIRMLEMLPIDWLL